MRIRNVAVGLLLLLVTMTEGFAADGEDAPPPVKIRVLRDLTHLPAGSFEIVQTYESESVTTEDYADPPVEPTKASNRNTLTFDVTVPPAPAEGGSRVATVTVRRIEMEIVQNGEFRYDSDGPESDQSEILYRQFHYLVGRTAELDLAAFGEGLGFEGLDAAWDEFEKDHPRMARAAKANRGNFGDARLDRMLVMGLDILFGADAGRAHGKSRELLVGEEFDVSIEKPGFGWKQVSLLHRCRVLAVENGDVVVKVEWHESGLRPEPGAEVLTVRGGDVRGSQEMTILADGGLLIGLTEEVVRTDQVAKGMPPVQWTTKTRQKKTFSIRPKPAAPPPGLFDRACALLEEGDHAGSLALFEQLLAEKPEAPNALYNAGLAAYTIGRYADAALYWLRLKRLFPGDWQVRAKLVQAWQALGDLDRRDEEKKALYALRETSEDPEVEALEFFCCEQFRVGGHKVVVFEHFELVGPRGIRWYFAVTDPDGDKFRLTLGSYDRINEVARDMGLLKDGQRRWHLDGYYDWGHATFGVYPGEPAYAGIRTEVIEILEGKREPISSSRTGPASEEDD